MKPGLEVGGVGTTAGINDRRQPLALHPAELPRFGVFVLRVDGEIGLVTGHAQLHHLPVAFVQADIARKARVVVEVEVPVLQPQPILGIVLRMAIDDIVQLRLRM